MKKIIFYLTVLSVFLSMSSARATLVKPLNIELLTEKAEYIVTAQVVDKQNQLDHEESGRMVTYYTLKVTDWIKGVPVNEKNELVFKQLADGQYSANGQVIKQNLFFPTYETGKTYLFFLSEPHHETGLTAPVGLWQGVFDVEYDSNGQMVLPQLKSKARQRLLQKDLKTKNKYLSLDVKDSKNVDASYNSFKKTVRGILGE